ncbi:MAG: AMP-binding protein, partial [Xanthobacteraceae bacterium]
MIHAHSLGRAAHYYGERAALASGAARPTFLELHDRVAGIAAALGKHGFRAGDRLALLLPNELDYLELVYACAWLGLIAVPVNTRLSITEIDHLIADASPRGLIRHSSLPVPTVKPSWELVLDQEPLEVQSDRHPEAIYDPDAILALVYTSGTTGHPKGVAVTHANILANVDHLNYWMPYQEGGAHLHAAPVFHILDFPFMFAAPAFGICQVAIPKFSPQGFCETVERERVSQSVLVPTMLNLLVQFSELEKYDLSSLERLAYGGSPVAPELIHQIRKVLPNLKLIQGYGLSETGFLTGLKDHEHTQDKLLSCGRTCPGVDLRVVVESGKELEAGGHGELEVRGANVMRGYWNKPEET